MAHAREGLFEKEDICMTLMFQKEVGKRIVAEPKTPERSRLGIMSQAITYPLLKATLDSNIFTPEPKVDAALVSLTPRKDGLLQGKLVFLFTANLMRKSLKQDIRERCSSRIFQKESPFNAYLCRASQERT
jgi:dimethyladenosine transferase 1